MAIPENLELEIKQLLVERLFLKMKPEDIGDEEPLMATYGIDSVALFELVVGLEEVYGITMEDDEFSLDLFKSIKSIADFVRAKLATSGG